MSYLKRGRKELYLFQVSGSDSNSFLLREDRICVRYLLLTIHVTNYKIKTDSQTLVIWSPWMFPNITYWALKLIRLTEDSYWMFFDSRFLSYSALKNIYSFRSISLRNMCNKFAYRFHVAGKSTANQTLQLLYLLKWSGRSVKWRKTCDFVPAVLF